MESKFRVLGHGAHLDAPNSLSGRPARERAEP